MLQQTAGRDGHSVLRAIHCAISGRRLARGGAAGRGAARSGRGSAITRAARNLHRAARQIVTLTAASSRTSTACALPGIGRSTAGAILALARGQRHPILDGNVKRVLSRVFLVRGAAGFRGGRDEALGARRGLHAGDAGRRLHAGDHGSRRDALHARASGLRSLSARSGCAALARDSSRRCPPQTSRAPRRVERTQMVFVLSCGATAARTAARRSGIWGGLWSPPEFPDAGAGHAAVWQSRSDRGADSGGLPASTTPSRISISTSSPGSSNCRRAQGVRGEMRLAGPGPARRRTARARDRLIKEHQMAQNGPMRAARPRGGRSRPLPYPGELGQRIFDNVSKEAWQKWLGHQTMLINEYRLVPFEPKARQFLVGEMEKFFFGGGSKAPEGLSRHPVPSLIRPQFLTPARAPCLIRSPEMAR